MSDTSLIPVHHPRGAKPAVMMTCAYCELRMVMAGGTAEECEGFLEQQMEVHLLERHQEQLAEGTVNANAL